MAQVPKCTGKGQEAMHVLGDLGEQLSPVKNVWAPVGAEHSDPGRRYTLPRGQVI